MNEESFDLEKQLWYKIILNEIEKDKNKLEEILCQKIEEKM